MKKRNLKYFILGVAILIFALAISFIIYFAFIKEENIEEINTNYYPVNEVEEQENNRENSNSDEIQNTEEKENVSSNQTITDSSNTQNKNESTNTSINNQSQSTIPRTNNSSSTNPSNSSNITKNEESKESQPVIKEEPKVSEPQEKTETVQSTTPKVKVTCSDANSKWKTFKSEYQISHKAKITLSREDGIAYGTKANSFGYGYYIDNFARNYSDDECEIDYWTTTVFVPNTTCGENDDIHIKKFIMPYTENFISIFEYLNKLGYDCHDRSL